MKKLISVFLCAVLLIAGVSINAATAFAATAAENTQLYLYTESSVDNITVHFDADMANGITSGDFKLMYDTDVFRLVNVTQKYISADFIFTYSEHTPGEVSLSFCFNEYSTVDSFGICEIVFEIITDVRQTSYIELSGEIDGVFFTFEPYAIDIVDLYFGDVDYDAKITASDARLVLRASVGLEEFDDLTFFLSDVDFDGKVTASDARLILRASVGFQ